MPSVAGGAVSRDVEGQAGPFLVFFSFSPPPPPGGRSAWQKKCSKASAPIIVLSLDLGGEWSTLVEPVPTGFAEREPCAEVVAAARRLGLGQREVLEFGPDVWPLVVPAFDHGPRGTRTARDVGRARLVVCGGTRASGRGKARVGEPSVDRCGRAAVGGARTARTEKYQAVGGGRGARTEPNGGK